MSSRSGPAVVGAVVIGAGHNGLVAAAILADAGWDVVVLDQSEPGGAVRSAELFPATSAICTARSIRCQWRLRPERTSS
jgi:glycine/D-amino acid oxidase-like deaminating enzyme